MAKSKVYTKTGDEGYTSLVGGKRVPKTNSRIEAYGTVDELNTFIASLLDEVNDKDDRNFLLLIQNTLFVVGGYLATEGNESKCGVSETDIEALEAEIDAIDELIPPLKAFVLPGGCKANSFSHICRAVCRRAERTIYKLAETENIDSLVLKYINRLSDYFFLFARKQSLIHNEEEIIWNNTCK
ncbi:cob(I)alamin adenosyltransferase [Dysgonomonadaceae bacterium PH5-43]|nr:cob(I)alamin adenosyltransferase [Dysgonomonadaceae bacterium PH5-43]